MLEELPKGSKIKVPQLDQTQIGVFSMQIPIIQSVWAIPQGWSRFIQQSHRSSSLPLMRPANQLPKQVRKCATTMRYHKLLVSIAWHQFPERNLEMAFNQMPISYVAFAAACLVKLDRGFTYMTDLHQYLSEHPHLTWLLGLPTPLPTARHFTRMLRQMPHDGFQFLLDDSVRLLQTEMSGEVSDFGQAISLDTKHIIAWVKENNPKAYTTDRFDATQQPADPDCRVGCKRKHNFQTPKTDAQPASSVEVGEYYWGYASGVVATKIPGWGEAVLAELTQPFDRPDVSYFHPLLEQTERRLGFQPRFGAFDAAFDAFYVYEHFHPKSDQWQDGFAAVPFSKRNARRKTFSPEGLPHCEADLPMIKHRTYMNHTSMISHERAVYTCPIIGQRDACPIDHAKWPDGGCVHRMPTSVGARARHQIDRESDLYKQIYRQRTATERINSQAVALGIERPKVRNQQAITNQNTLIYVLINLRLLQRIRQQKDLRTGNN
jgi:hypothetical protein